MTLVLNFCSNFDENLYRDEEIIKRIKLAQRDHISVSFESGIIRIIIADVQDDVDDGKNIINGTKTQWWATYIANCYNLQPFIYRDKNDRCSLVIVSQLGGPISERDALCIQFDKMEIK